MIKFVLLHSYFERALVNYIYTSPPLLHNRLSELTLVGLMRLCVTIDFSAHTLT